MLGNTNIKPNFEGQTTICGVVKEVESYIYNLGRAVEVIQEIGEHMEEALHERKQQIEQLGQQIQDLEKQVKESYQEGYMDGQTIEYNRRNYYE